MAYRNLTYIYLIYIFHIAITKGIGANREWVKKCYLVRMVCSTVSDKKSRDPDSALEKTLLAFLIKRKYAVPLSSA